MLRGVTFMEDGGVLIEYLPPSDIKSNGCARASSLAVPPGVIDSELAELEGVVERTLNAALAAFEQSPTEEGDDEGPAYDNPDEREDYR